MEENEKENKQTEPAKPKRPSFPKPGDKPPFNIYWIYGVLALAFIAIQFMDFGSTSKKLNWHELSSKIRSGEVSRIIVVNGQKAEVFTGSSTQPDFHINIGDIATLKSELDEIQANLPERERIKPQFETREDYVGNLIGWLLPIVILVAVWLFIFKRMSGGMGGPGGGIFSIGKSKAKVFDKEESEVKTNFNDVAGLEEAKIEIREIVDFLKNPGKYTDLGGKIPKGALLVGPPGTGKTLLAKAVAGEAHVPFFSMSGSDFVEMFVGVGASRVRDLFKQAKEKAPCIIFIDEIDAIGRARGKNPNMGANDERENTLNQLLTEMDGFDTNTGVIILAATNRADILDKALLRAGRFDREIHVELPDINEREAIFGVHLKPLKLAEDVSASFIAKQTPGFSGADIANVCNEAALIAARKDKKSIEKQDFLDAIDRIIGGLEKRNKIITADEKRTIAFHEAGHATLSWVLEYAHPLIKVTIIPRGKALGAAWYLPEERQITTKEQIIDEMCATLGGRAAEELIFGKISTGALNDLERVTKQAYAMVTYYGMGTKLGHVSYFDSSGQNDFGFTKPFSEKTNELIDEEVKDMVDKAYYYALETLTKHKDGLSKLANILLEKEVLFAEDLENIFGARKSGSRSDMPSATNVIDNAEQQS
jgi:AFG3 family protein